MEHSIPDGFRMAGVHCGIKSDPERPDLTLVVADRPSVAAAVYTQNRIVAAPVLVDRERTPSDRVRAVVVNSGNANACTGDQGIEDARQMCRLVAQQCDLSEEQVLVMSTGIIGHRLPMERIAQGIPDAVVALGNDAAHLAAAAQGIMTTDQFPKVASRRAGEGPTAPLITGIAKGAGMIGPNMATMLAVIVTDARLSPDDAQAILIEAVDVSFNCISVEGHTSTNDTVVLLANGEGPELGASVAGRELFRDALSDVCRELARMIPADGEGAKHLITIDVTGCATRADAAQIARTVANSPLVKTAIAGGDPNWGRIVSAAGYAGVPFEPAQLSLRINGTTVFQRGVPVPSDVTALAQSLRRQRDAHLELQLEQGAAKATFWTSDLTVEYVQFNSEYTT